MSFISVVEKIHESILTIKISRPMLHVVHYINVPYMYTHVHVGKRIIMEKAYAHCFEGGLFICDRYLYIAYIWAVAHVNRSHAVPV